MPETVSISDLEPVTETVNLADLEAIPDPGSIRATPPSFLEHYAAPLIGTPGERTILGRAIYGQEATPQAPDYERGWNLPLIKPSTMIKGGDIPGLSNFAKGIVGHAEEMTTPGMAPLLLATGPATEGIAGVLKLGDYGTKVFSRLISAGFGIDMLRGAYQSVEPFKKAVQRGNYEEAAKIAGGFVFDATMAGYSLKHGVMGEAPKETPGEAVRRVMPPGEIKPERVPLDQIEPISHEDTWGYPEAQVPKQPETVPIDQLEAIPERNAISDIEPNIQPAKDTSQVEWSFGKGGIRAAQGERSWELAAPKPSFELEALKGKSTIEAYKNPISGTWKPERAAYHEEVLDKMLAGKQASGDQPKIFMLGGGTASGKTTASRIILGEDPNVLRIDPDELKLAIPEYAGLKQENSKTAAGKVHDESSYLSKELLARAVASGLDIVYDTTTSGNGKASTIKTLKDNGYFVDLMFFDVPVEEAIRRAKHRAEFSTDPINKGREIAEDVIHTIHGEAARNYFELKDLVPRARLFDTQLRDNPRQVHEQLENKPETVHNIPRYEEFQKKGGLYGETSVGPRPDTERGGRAGASGNDSPSESAISKPAAQGQPAQGTSPEPVEFQPVSGPGQVVSVPTDQIQLATEKFQPREGVNKSRVQAIAEDMGKNGYDTKWPIELWRNPTSKKLYVLAGHHRYEAALVAGIKDIPARIYDNLSLDEAKDFARRSNSQAAPLKPMEEARVFDIEAKKGKGLEEISNIYGGKKTGDILDRISLMNLDPSLQQLVQEGTFDLPQATVLAKATARYKLSPALQDQIFKKIVMEMEVTPTELKTMIDTLAPAAQEQMTMGLGFTIERGILDPLEEMVKKGREINISQRRLKGFIKEVDAAEKRGEPMAASTKQEVVRVRNRIKDLKAQVQELQSSIGQGSKASAKQAIAAVEPEVGIREREVYGMKTKDYSFPENQKYFARKMIAIRDLGQKFGSMNTRVAEKVKILENAIPLRAGKGREIVYRVGSGGGELGGRNAANAEGIIAFLDSSDENLIATGDKITAFEVATPKNTGEYKQLYQPERQRPPEPTSLADFSKQMAEAGQRSKGEAVNELVGQLGDKVLGSLKNAGDLEGTPMFPKAEEPSLFGPGAQSVKQPQPATLVQLTQAVEGATTRKQSLSERMAIGRQIAQQATAAKDSVSQAFASLKGNAAAIWDAYKRPPEVTGFKDMLGKYLGARQKSGLETHRFVKETIKNLNPRTREALVNYIEAGGDDKVLASRATQSKPEFKQGYEDARKLTPEQKVLADNFRNYFDSQLAEAQKAGILEAGVDEYVNHIWQRDNKVSKKIKAEINAGLLQTDPALAKKRIWETYFAGEQSGGIPANKDIGFLAASYDMSLNEAIQSRAFIKSLLDGKASDGRPLAAVSGSGKTLGDLPDQPDSYLIKPKTKPENTQDYRPIDHPALRKWKWVAQDPEGKPILVQGDILVHPESYQHLKNVLSKSAIRENPVGRAILGGVQTLKSTLLSLSGFHQTQEGLHAIFHRVNPATAPAIDLAQPKQMALVDHGLMIYNHNALADFAEGVHSGGLLNRVPGLGGMLQKYGEYLFSDYIPRLKMKMATDALERNTKRYAGKLSSAQIHEMTANQANAAFGELNYKYMGRNPTLQDALRLMTLAPDFLEARGRFVGQALKPFGMEQRAALIRGAIGMYVIARVANQILDKDPHWELSMAFALKFGKETFQLRSVPGDIMHLVTDPRSFIYHRLNPTIARTLIESLTGRDQYGNKVALDNQIKDVFKAHVPIPLQGLAGKDRTLLESALSSIGVSTYPYRSSAEKTAISYIQENTPKGEKTPLQHEQSMAHWKLLEDLRAGKKESLQSAVQAGTLSKREAIDLRRKAQSTRLQTDVKGLPLAVALDVWDSASPEEKKQIRREVVLKEQNFLKGKSKEEIQALNHRIQKFNVEQRSYR